MRLLDAYRRGTITYSQYINLLESGHSPNELYSAGMIPSPEPSNTWIEILDWDTDGIGPKNIVVENTDSNYNLECKIEIYIDDILVRTESSVFSNTFNKYIGDPCTNIIVSVRSVEYGQSASYNLAYTNDY